MPYPREFDTSEYLLLDSRVFAVTIIVANEDMIPLKVKVYIAIYKIPTKSCFRSAKIYSTFPLMFLRLYIPPIATTSASSL